MDDIDIYRVANLLIDQHGENAPLQAAAIADAMLEKGDLDGKLVWKAVLKAIEEIQRAEPADGEQLQ